MSRELSPTRSTLLELMEERRLVEESYEFLDEKRILLAGELLRQLARYRDLETRFSAQHTEAHEALVHAARRHGLRGLTVYPALSAPNGFESEHGLFLGIVLVDAETTADPSEAASAPAANPSPEARACRAAFHALLRTAAPMAAAYGNLRRLGVEYAKTERRARALEKVLLPEIESDLDFVEEQLEALEQEEVLRVRHALSRR